MIDTSKLRLAYDYEDTATSDNVLDIRKYLQSHTWCWHLTKIYIARESGPTVSLAEFKAFVVRAGPQVWVISGDMPFSYLDTSRCETAADALALYCVLSTIWVQRVVTKRDISSCIELRDSPSGPNLGSVADAVSLIPRLVTVIEPLVEDQAAFLSLPEELKEDLVTALGSLRRWIERRKLRDNQQSGESS